jgi:hypothetical protein
VLNRTAAQAAFEADVVVLVADAHGWTPPMTRHSRWCPSASRSCSR